LTNICLKIEGLKRRDKETTARSKVKPQESAQGIAPIKSSGQNSTNNRFECDRLGHNSKEYFSKKKRDGTTIENPGNRPTVRTISKINKGDVEPDCDGTKGST